MARTAARLLIDLLVDEWGVRHIFSLPGDGINGIYEALRERQDDVQLVVVRHEEAAAFAACAYAKFTGRLGVCLATSGPGAIHLLNGLYDAKLDGASVLAITGQTYHDLIGTRYQQDVNLTALFSDVAIFNEEIRAPSHVESMTQMAVKSALWRRGVAHLNFPLDLQQMPVSDGLVSNGLGRHRAVGQSSATWSRPIVTAAPAALDAAASLLNDEKAKIAVLVGQGALGATAELLAVADRLAAPIVSAYLGKAVVPDDEPLAMGGVGLLGSRSGEAAIAQCDTLLIVGSSMPYLSYYPKPGSARCIQIDIDPVRIGLRYPADVGLPGDSRATLAALLPRLTGTHDREWLQSLQTMRDEWRGFLADRASDGPPLSAACVAAALNGVLPDDAILCGDSGTNTTFFARYLAVRPGMMASGSGTLATMASGLPYAIAAQIAYPARRAVALVGDGGFTMLMGEMLTAVKYRLPIVVVILRNDTFGQIKWEQIAFNGNPEFGISLHNPHSFAAWAENCGGRGWSITRAEDLGPALAAAFATTDRPCLIEAHVNPDEMPMPPSVTTEQARHFASALLKGQPHGGRLALTAFRDKLDELLHP
jgi:thiamine pyrophosphate-dependent acetolactate synthase large subunit-like protein